MSDPSPPNGGPAFPHPRLETPKLNDFGYSYIEPSQGMSLRSYAAVHIFAGALAGGAKLSIDKNSIGLTQIQTAIDLADTLIAELNKEAAE
jgi:hypothetical protein